VRLVRPKNLYLDRAPYTHAEYRREVIDRQIELRHERDIWRRPDKSWERPTRCDIGAVIAAAMSHRCEYAGSEGSLGL